jgi:hypothetical protein
MLATQLRLFETLVTAKYLGASTTFVRAVGFVEQSVAAEHVEDNAYS